MPGMSTPPSSPPGEGTVLLASRDPVLRADVARLAAGAGCGLHPCETLEEVRRCWPLGSAVVVGRDLVGELAMSGLPRRPGVHVVGSGTFDDSVLRAALTLGAEAVVELPAGAPQLAGLLGEVSERDHPPGHVVGVVGGSGGVGASVLSVAVATVASTSQRCVVVDLDPDGAGLQLLAGLGDDAAGDGGRVLGPAAPGWDALASGSGRLNARALRESLSGQAGNGGSGCAVLGWASGSSRLLPSAPVVAETLAAARRGHDWVVVDAGTPAATTGCDAVILVVAGTVPGVAAARRRLADLPGGVPVGLAVRSARQDRWGRDVARALALPLWSVVPHQRGLDDHLSAGLGPVRRRRAPLARSATQILAAIGRGS